jgi:hypothetical protein
MTKQEVSVASSEWEAFGKLKEGIHIAGYTFERACQSLKWLLQDRRWQLCGFDDVNEFLGSLGFDKFKKTAEERADIAKLCRRGRGRRGFDAAN